MDVVELTRYARLGYKPASCQRLHLVILLFTQSMSHLFGITSTRPNPLRSSRLLSNSMTKLYLNPRPKQHTNP